MKRIVSGIALGFLLGAWFLPCSAQVIAIDPVEAGLFYSSDKTKTFLWAAKNPKATLVFIPGGEGQLRLPDDRKNLGGFYGTTLRPLSDAGLTSGILNVVVFDSPFVLPVGTNYPDARATADHLMRIRSVVLYYNERFKLPVWLMGHSNGAVSITEFYKSLQKGKQEGLVAGVVYSSARNGADFNAATSTLPVLFLAHNQDGCAKATNAYSRSVYESLKRVDTARIEYVLVKGGAPEGDPCRSGYHMFFGASEEAYKAIDSFIGAFYK